MAEIKKTYAELLLDPKWQECRLKALKRDKFTCKLCGDKETTLHVHHKSYTWGRNPWDYPIDNFVLLCAFCHTEVEANKSIFTPDFIYKKVIHFFHSNQKKDRILVYKNGSLIKFSEYHEKQRVNSFSLPQSVLSKIIKNV